MNSDKEQKQQLLASWIAAHAPGNSAPLFLSMAPLYEPTPAAVELLQRRQQAGISLYVMCFGDPRSTPIPAYTGKASDPWQRWKDGHLRGLRYASRGKPSGLYTRWVQLLDRVTENINILRVSESQILFSPIPGLPATIGAIEYQIVSLTRACYPEYLLNHEGAAR